MITGHAILLPGCVRPGPGGVRLTARVRASTADCARCGQPASRVHSTYRRHLADTPISGRPVEVVLQVRRFFCDNDGCPARRFAEQVPGLTTPRARRTGLLTATSCCEFSRIRILELPRSR